MQIRTRSRSDKGFRRAGVRHTPEPQTWPDKQFTKAQLEQLEQDPQIIVEKVADDAKQDDGKADGKSEKK